MDAPKCKICGDRHYGLCAQPRSRNAPTEATETAAISAERAGAAGVPAGETAPGFDRNAYQREYMRKRRAVLKDGKHR